MSWSAVAAAQESPRETAVLIDLSVAPGDPAVRSRLEVDLRAQPGIAVLPPALARPRWSADLAAATAALADLDCEAARARARAAVLGLAVARAAGEDVMVPLSRAYVVWLRCAAAADSPMLIDRLRKLGHQEPPRGVSPAEWQSSPSLPAAPATLHVDAPSGARVWLDHIELGTAPLTTHTTVGPHLLVATQDQRSSASDVVVEGPEQRVALVLSSPPASDDPAEAARGRWRGRDKPPQPSEVGALLKTLKLRVALLLMPGGQVHIWALPAGTRFARRVSGAPADDAAYVARLVRDWAKRQDQPPPTDEIPLLREDPNKREDATHRSTRWWVYAAVGLAVTVAGAIIISDQFATDRQRIEVELMLP